MSAQQLSSLFISLGLDVSPAQTTLQKFERQMDGAVMRMTALYTQQISDFLNSRVSELGRNLVTTVERKLSQPLESAVEKSMEGISESSKKALTEIEDIAIKSVKTVQDSVDYQVRTVQLGVISAKNSLETAIRTFVEPLDAEGSQVQKVIVENLKSLVNSIDILTAADIDGRLKGLSNYVGKTEKGLAKVIDGLRSQYILDEKTGLKALTTQLEGTLKPLQVKLEAFTKDMNLSVEKANTALADSINEATKIYTERGIEGAEEAVKTLQKGSQKAIEGFKRTTQEATTTLYKGVSTAAAKGINNLDATPIKNAVGEISNRLSTMQEEVSNQISSGLKSAEGSVSNVFGGAIQKAFGSKVFAQTVAVGLSSAVGIVGPLIGESISAIIQIATGARLEVLKATIGGYINFVTQGLLEYGNEQEHINTGVFVGLKKTGNLGNIPKGGRASDDENFKKRFADTEKIITQTATDLSYSREEIAKFFELLVKAGFSLDEVIGPENISNEARKKYALYQGAAGGEASGLAGQNLGEMGILIKQFQMAFPLESLQTIIRELLALNLSTPAELERFKFATQDSLSAFAQAGVSLRDIMSSYSVMFNLSTPEVAGSSLRILQNTMNNPNRVDSVRYGKLSKYFEGDFLTSLQETPGRYLENMAKLDVAVNNILKSGEASELADGGGISAEQYNKLGTRDQVNKRMDFIQKTFGLGDTDTIAYKNLVIEGYEGAEKRRKEFENINSPNFMEEFINLRQSGLKGAMSVLEGTIENIRRLMGDKLGDGFTHFVIFIRKIGDELTANVDKFTGPLERISQKLTELFSGEDIDKKVTSYANKIGSVFATIGSVLEEWITKLLEFFGDEEKFNSMIVNLQDLIMGFKNFAEVLFNIIQRFLPLINGAGSDLSDWASKLVIDRTKKELENSQVEGATSKIFSSAIEQGYIKDIDNRLKDPSVLKTLDDAEVENIAKNISRDTNTGRFVNREKRGLTGQVIGYLAENEKFGDLSEEEKRKTIKEGYRKLNIKGKTIYISSGEKSEAFMVEQRIGGVAKIPFNEFSKDIRDEINRLILGQKESKPIQALNERALASFVDDKTFSNLNLDKSPERRRGFVMAQEEAVKSLFGSGAKFDTNTGEVSGISDVDFNSEQFNKVLQVFSGQRGGSAITAMEQTLKANPNLKNFNIINSLMQGAYGQGNIANASVFEEIKKEKDKGATEEEIKNYLGNIKKNIFGNITSDFKSGAANLKDIESDYKDKIEKGEIVGDFETFWSELLAQLTKTIDEKGISDAERQRRAKEIREFGTEKGLGGPKPPKLSTATEKGIAQNTDDLLRQITAITEQRINQERKILEIKQDTLELERKSLVLSTSFMGRANNTLENLFGIFNSSERSILSLENKLTALDLEAKRKNESLINDFGKVVGEPSGSYEKYGNTGREIFIPKSSTVDSVQQLNDKLIADQKAIIDLKLQEKREIEKQVELVKVNLYKQLQNTVVQTFQKAASSLQSLYTAGGSNQYVSQGSQLFETFMSSSIDIAQSIQSLKILEKVAPGGLTGEQQGALNGLETALEQLPKVLEENLKSLINSMTRGLDSFFFDLMEKTRNRTNELLGMMMSSSVGQAINRLIGDMNAELFKNSQERGTIQDENRAVQNQVNLNRMLGSFFPDQFFDQKASIAEASIEINNGKIEGLNLDAQFTKEATGLKGNILLYQGLVETFKGARDLTSGFSTTFDEINSFAQRTEDVNKKVYELTSTIGILKEQFDAINALNSEMIGVDKDKLEQNIKYVESQKKAVEALLEIERATGLAIARLNLQKTKSESLGSFYTSTIERNSSEVAILGLNKSKKAQKQSLDIQLENANLEYWKATLEISNKYDIEREQIRSELEKNKVLAKSQSIPIEERERATIAYKTAELRLQQIDNEIINSKAKAYNDFATKVVQLESQMSDTDIINGKIVDSVDSAFDSLYDVLTDSSKSFSEKMKSFAQSLFKDLGKIGWGFLKDQILSPFKDMMTRKKVDLANPTAPNFKDTVGPNFGTGIQNPEDPKVYEELSDRTVEMQKRQQAQLKAVNDRIRSAVIDRANIGDAGAAASKMYQTLAQTISNNVDDPALQKLIAMGATGEEGMATNIATQTAIQESIKTTLEASLMELQKLSGNNNGLGTSSSNPNNGQSFYIDSQGKKHPLSSDIINKYLLQGQNNVQPTNNKLPTLPSPGLLPATDSIPNPIPTNSPNTDPTPVIQTIKKTVEDQLRTRPENAEFYRLLQQRRDQGLTGGGIKFHNNFIPSNPLTDQETRRQLENQLRNSEPQSSLGNLGTLIASGISDIPMGLGNMIGGGGSPLSFLSGIPAFSGGSIPNIGAYSGIAGPSNFSFGGATGAGGGAGAGGLGGFLGSGWGSLLMMALPLVFSLFTGGKNKRPKRYASGGFVEGIGNGDTVPAMLTPGEGVIKKDILNQMGGRAAIENLNAGLGLNNLSVNKPSNSPIGSLGINKVNNPHYQESVIKTEPIRLEYTARTVEGTPYVSEENFKKALENSVRQTEEQIFSKLQKSSRTRKALGL